MRQLTGLDEMWFSLEAPNTPMHITDVHVYDPSTAPGGRVTPDDIKTFITQRLDRLYMREKRVPVPFGLDYSYWVEDQGFDLDHHVRFHKLPKPGNWRQFREAVQTIIEAPLDMSHPLWEMHVIEGVDDVEGFPKGCFAVVHKKHHGQFDGSSATYLKSAIHTLEPTAKAETLPAKEAAAAEGVASQLAQLSEVYWNSLMKPLARTSFIYRTLPNLPKAMDAVIKDAMRMAHTPRTRFSGTIPSPRRVVGAQTFPLEEVQNLRKAVPGSTVNDVVITVFSGALRRYLAHHEELPTDALKGLVPVSVRKEEETELGGNKVFSMVTALHTEVADPLERMAKVHESTTYSKEFNAALDSRAMCEAAELAPLTIMDGAIKFTVSMKVADYVDGLYSGIGMSNVPGSRVPLYFCGAKQLQCYSWGFLMDGMGLLLAGTSYAGQMVFSTVSCPEIMPDVEFFDDCIQEGFAELVQAAQAQGGATKARPAIEAPPAKAAKVAPTEPKKTAAPVQAKAVKAKPEVAAKSAAGKPAEPKKAVTPVQARAVKAKREVAAKSAVVKPAEPKKATATVQARDVKAQPKAAEKSAATKPAVTRRAATTRRPRTVKAKPEQATKTEAAKPAEAAKPTETAKTTPVARPVEAVKPAAPAPEKERQS